MASTYLTRTPSSASNKKTFTFSVWFKLSKVSGDLNLLSNNGASDTRDYISLESGKLRVASYSGGYVYNLYTNRVFRDTSGWYHLVVAFDTTQSTSSNRIKIYVNGVQETSFNTASYPSQNLDTNYNKTSAFWISRDFNGVDYFYFDGSMSHLHWIDGTQYDASAFGSTDATTGEWKINTSPSVTYGTNGFTILKDGNTITDQSTNSNNWSLASGTLTKTEDNPSNVFATYNANYQSAQHSITKGNTEGVGGNSSWYMRTSSLGASSGKFYAEVKCSNVGGGTGIVGICDLDDCKGYAVVDSHFGKTAVTPDGRGFAWYSSDGKIYFNDTSTSVFGTWGTNSILMLAMDIDNQRFYIGKDGTWLNSGDPTSGATGTGSVQNWTTSVGGTWTFADALANGCTMQWNWGNGYFGTTAVSSAGTNASGNGIFEYDVPANFTALSTKGLNL